MSEFDRDIQRVPERQEELLLRQLFQEAADQAIDLVLAQLRKRREGLWIHRYELGKLSKEELANSFRFAALGDVDGLCGWGECDGRYDSLPSDQKENG